MIYEYAVDPSFFTSEEKAMFILESFGRDHGRLVSEIKKDHWVNLVREAIRKSENPPISKHRLTEALKLLTKNKKALYMRQQQVQNSDWHKMIEESHRFWPYRGILAEKGNCCNEHYLMRDIYLSDKEKWQTPTSLTVDREAAAILSAVDNLLANAREVILVDRNFRLVNEHGQPTGRFKHVLLSIAKFVACKPYGPKVGKLSYHIGDQYFNASNVEIQFNKYLRAGFPENLAIEFSIWPKNELHDRFILTDIGGIDCGVGLDEFTGSGTRTVTLKRLSNEDYLREWSNFKNKKVDISLCLLNKNSTINR